MKRFLLLLVPLLAVSHPLRAGADGSPSGDGAGGRPNLVVIMADDLGFADLGCYGSEIRTPNLDALATGGLRFSQFYNTAKCHSSRVSLLTGLYCDQAGGQSLARGATIAEVLQSAGYATAMVGKWHLSKQPTDFGFERYWGHLSGATNYFTGDGSFRLSGAKWEVPQELNGKPFYTTTAITDFAIRFVDEMRVAPRPATTPPTPTPPTPTPPTPTPPTPNNPITNNPITNNPITNNPTTNNPFLLYLAYNAPHYPLQAPEAEVAKYRGVYAAGWDVLRAARHKKQIESGLLTGKWALSPRPGHVPAWDSLPAEEQAWEARRMEVYAAMVDVLDQNIGRFVAHLKATGAWENTLVLFCSDNGACPFDRTRGKEREPWDANSYWCYDVGWAHLGNTPFRLYKQNQHEGGISSPLIVSWPAGLKAGPDLNLSRSAGNLDRTLRPTPLGAVTDQPGHLIDFMATVLDLGKAAYPEQVGERVIDPLQGLSLAPIFRGEARAGHDTLYQHFGTDRALRQGDWKVVAAKGGRWELYNMREDRTELHDRAAHDPQRARRMTTEWFRIAKDLDRLKPNQRKPGSGTLTPLHFGVRKDREATEGRTGPRPK